MFYFPHWVWKQLEGGRLNNIIDGLHKADCEKSDEKIENLAKYMKERKSDQYEHKMWAAKLYFCEILNFVNIIFQICMTDRFLGYSFSEYGTEVLSWSNDEAEGRTDPMSRVFPRITKCKFQKFGPGGTIQLFDALCVLGMNIINEKVFIFLWFWFIIVAIITALNLVENIESIQIQNMAELTEEEIAGITPPSVYRVATWFVPAVRGRLVQLEKLGLRPSNDQARHFNKFLTETAYEDWLIIYYLARCMNPQMFYQLIIKMSGSGNGETHIEDEDETDKNNIRDDSTLLSKAKLRLPFSRP